MVELITIGHSYEGQPIKMVKISTGPDKGGEAKPAVWIDAGEFLFPCYVENNERYSVTEERYRRNEWTSRTSTCSTFSLGPLVSLMKSRIFIILTGIS